MRITAELSLYPLGDDFLPKIQSVIRMLRDRPKLEVAVNQMSTQVRGELRDVIAAVHAAMELSFAAGDPEVLVAKFLNADLPIAEEPDVGTAD